MPISNSTKERVGVEVSGPRVEYVVLEPKETMEDPNRFNNMEVTFFRVNEEDVEIMEEQIAKIQFSDDKYTVFYYQGGIVLGNIPEPMEIEPYPLLIDLHPPDETRYPTHYQVEVQPHRQYG